MKQILRLSENFDTRSFEKRMSGGAASRSDIVLNDSEAALGNKKKREKRALFRQSGRIRKSELLQSSGSAE